MADATGQTVVLLTGAILVLAIFYLMRSIARRRVVMKFLMEKGAFLRKAVPAAKKAKPKRKPAKKKKRR